MIIMIKKNRLNNGYIHLYNPKEEGLGLYDINYINAYRKNNEKELKEYIERDAA